MGLRMALGGLPEIFLVLGEPCGPCFGYHLGSKVGARRSRFYRTLLVSVEADADAYLEMKNGTSSMAPGFPARARTSFFVAQVKLARGPIPRRAFGVIGRVLLLSFANVLALPFATR